MIPKSRLPANAVGLAGTVLAGLSAVATAGALAVTSPSPVPAAASPRPSPTAAPAAVPTPTVPPALAAPPAEPRVYVFTLLRKGPVWTAAETPEVRALQAGHMANITRLGQEGKLAAAGPCGDGDLRGIFVFATASLDEARAWGESDPAVKAGRLKLEPYRLLGAPGLGRRAAAEAAQAGGKTTLVEYQLVLVRRGARFDPTPSDENRALYKARNAWLEQLQATGKLALSGPFIEGGERLGVLVLRAGSIAAARALMAGDPAVKTERFAFDVEPWWLSKGTLD